MVVYWGDVRDRRLCLRPVDVPADKFLGFLRSLESQLPATRRRRHPGRKGKGCAERRKLARARASNSVDSVQVPDAGTVEFVDSVGASGSMGDCVSGALDLGRLVDASDVASRSSRTVLRPSGLSLPFPRPTRVAGVGGLVTGHGGTRPELQVFESEDSGACLVPGSESDYESCDDGSSDDLGPSESAEGAGAAVAAADAAAAALGAAASAQAAISAVQDSLGSARRRRKRVKRFAKKFVGSALSRVWRARTAAQTSTFSSLRPVAAKFVPAPRWGNSPMERYPLVLASASPVTASVLGGLGAAAAPVLAVEESADSGSRLVSSEFAEGAGAVVAAAGAAAVAFAAAASARAAILAVQDSLGTAKRQRKRKKRDAKKFVSTALSKVWRARTAAQTSSSASLPVASTAGSNAAVGMCVFGPVAEVPTAREVDDEVCGCLDGDALFDICFRVVMPTLGSLPWWTDHRQSFSIQGCICRRAGEECRDPKCCWGNS